jgi:tRNA-dihydrouridine synthase 1
MCQNDSLAPAPSISAVISALVYAMAQCVPQVNANAWQDVRARGDEWTTCATDRPVLCQFASHDPEVLVKVVKEVQHEVDGVDLNLGCPQGIARRGRYGSWLQDEWQLIYDMVASVAQQCSVPITVKIRVFDDHERTLQVQFCIMQTLRLP